MQEGFDLITIVFLCLAVFVIWRLRSVLGQRTGNENSPADPFTHNLSRDKQSGRQDETMAESADARDDSIVYLHGSVRNDIIPNPLNDPDRWKGTAELDSPVAKALDAILNKEPSFNIKTFQEGAKAAYEYIVTAFAKGDRKVLKGLLSSEIFEDFDRAISERENRGEAVSTAFVSVDKAEIQFVEVENNTAQITVCFTSKLITTTYDVEGNVIDGAPDKVVNVSDTWTFSRNLGSRDPNWMLVDTEASQS